MGGESTVTPSSSVQSFLLSSPCGRPWASSGWDDRLGESPSSLKTVETGVLPPLTFQNLAELRTQYMKILIDWAQMSRLRIPCWVYLSNWLPMCIVNGSPFTEFQAMYNFSDAFIESSKVGSTWSPTMFWKPPEQRFQVKASILTFTDYKASSRPESHLRLTGAA